MTSKQLIETFRKIKEHCIGRNCEDCKFHVPRSDDVRQCQLSILAYELLSLPSSWNMEEIERIINETD